MQLGKLVGIVLGLVMAAAALAPAMAGTNTEGPPQVRPGDDTLLPGTDRLTPYRGDVHSQTAFSDGGDTPREAFSDAKATGWLDFFAVTDHSEWLAFPFVANSACIEPGERLGDPTCPQLATPLPQRTEWEDTGYQAHRFTDEDFLAIRGFEWSSFVEGHVNVFNTRVWTDSVQTGQAPMTGLYAWIAGQQLDEDRWATFNHPGRVDEGLKFDNYTYEPRMDRFFHAIDAFNKDDDYSDEYTKALDKGWHLGVQGVTDGHETDERIDPARGHTVALMTDLTMDALTRAWEQHHTVAVQGRDQDARFLVEDTLMGDIAENAPSTVTVELTLLDGHEQGADTFEKVDLLGPRGWQRTLAIGEDAPCQRVADEDREIVSCQTTVAVDDLPTTDLDERYLTARAHQLYEGEVRPTVMPSAVWIER